MLKCPNPSLDPGQAVVKHKFSWWLVGILPQDGLHIVASDAGRAPEQSGDPINYKSIKTINYKRDQRRSA